MWGNDQRGIGSGAPQKKEQKYLRIWIVNHQEESIGLCSGLLKSQQSFLDTFYLRHRQEPRWVISSDNGNNLCSSSRDGLYSHSMIWSPQVPVFRDDVSLDLLEEVIFANFDSSAQQVHQKGCLGEHGDQLCCEPWPLQKAGWGRVRSRGGDED